MGWKDDMLRQLLNLQLQQARDAQQPNPYLQQLMGYNQGILNWHTNPGNTVKDIYKHPTLGSKLPVFQFAKTMRDAGRIGRGISGISDKFDPAAAKQQFLEDSFNRDTAASGMLEQGLGQELDQTQANMANLIGMQSNLRHAGDAATANAMNALIGIGAGRGGGFWGSLFRGLASGFGAGAASGAGAGLGAILAGI